MLARTMKVQSATGVALVSQPVPPTRVPLAMVAVRGKMRVKITQAQSGLGSATLQGHVLEDIHEEIRPAPGVQEQKNCADDRDKECSKGYPGHLLQDHGRNRSDKKGMGLLCNTPL